MLLHQAWVKLPKSVIIHWHMDKKKRVWIEGVFLLSEDRRKAWIGEEKNQIVGQRESTMYKLHLHRKNG